MMDVNVEAVRRAYEDEIARLARDKALLRAQVEALEAKLSEGD
jgi:hypothetical protein